jgi:hypothetical protein
MLLIIVYFKMRSVGFENDARIMSLRYSHYKWILNMM